MKRLHILTIQLLTAATMLLPAVATAATEAADSATTAITYPIRKIGITAPAPELRERVIVRGDTVPLIMQERNFGRYDRGLFNYLFMPKGQWMAGLTASYADFDASDVQILDALKDFDFKGEIYSVKPYVAYVFSNNNTVGLRFTYTHANANLGNLSVDLGDDLSFDIHGVHYSSQSYGASVFYRHYIGLNRSKRFGIFNEIDLGFSSGASEFRRTISDVEHVTRGTTTSANLNFSPGVTVFVMDYISFNVSFGVFGLHMTHEKQVTDDVEDGSRFTSGANFRFNIFNINFGLGVHI
ncbi:MAG: hypothetical protein NC187_04250 [Candidatus Amulumruptor caecigallinarius]|nr:hypothetical protein [Candidatus Amulumruptor caecigallinarius]MCM1396684.1 hypothetical protein [Candidatus Amulumruptor caecigallinarius]MCM1453258.1 hypothetical protein [bacterium]